MRFAIDKFPEDLARRINIHIASKGESRRDLTVRAIKKILDEEEAREKGKK
jgi:metal-responsive CopG/Arc/MetJ family transcriptional regulator